MSGGTFCIEVYGCQMNFYDAGKIADSLICSGLSKTDDPYNADILVFYTCSIREKAAQRLYSNINRYKSDKTKIVAVGGCVAQQEGRALLNAFDAIDIVFGPQNYQKLPEYIEEVLEHPGKKIVDTDLNQSANKFGALRDKQSAGVSEFVTIQEGCNNFCTYCVVPHTRGREYSRPVQDIIEEARRLIDLGTKEITLLGQNVNSYDGEAPYVSIGGTATWRLERLIEEIAKLDGLKRLRYTTSHPKDFTKELMQQHADIDVLVPFVHIPVQSGNDRILKMMNRGHTADEYLNKLEMFRNVCGDIQFSSDFIVGFPTETEDEFEDTVTIAKKSKYVMSYSFKYSKRKNTPAAQMTGQIPENVKVSRLKKLQEVLFRDQEAFNKSLIGTVQNVLFELKGKKANQYLGKNVYFQSVLVNSETDLRGSFQNVTITDGNQNSLFGKL